jgi:hypothetical protein
VSNIPKAVSENELTIFCKRLRCYVLEDGQRIVNADDVAALFSTDTEVDGDAGEDAMLALADFLKGKT